MPRLESGSGTKSDQIDNLQPFANHLLKIFGYLWLISKLLQGNFSARVVLKKLFFFLFQKQLHDFRNCHDIPRGRRVTVTLFRHFVMGLSLFSIYIPQSAGLLKTQFELLTARTFLFLGPKSRVWWGWFSFWAIVFAFSLHLHRSLAIAFFCSPFSARNWFKVTLKAGKYLWKCVWNWPE